MTTDHNPIQIDPEAIYADGVLRVLLGVTSSALIQARRAGDLQFARRGKKVFYRGQWVIDWLCVPTNQTRERSP
jgi:hypothetical protein